MATFVIAFSLGAAATAVLFWLVRGKSDEPSQSTSADDNAEILSQISGAHSFDEAELAALAYVAALPGVTHAAYLEKRGDHFRPSAHAEFSNGDKSVTTILIDQRIQNLLTGGHRVLPFSLLTDKAEHTPLAVAQTWDRCVPVFWGHHIYGLILLATAPASFKEPTECRLRVVSQMLSAVSHIESMRPAQSVRGDGGTAPKHSHDSGDGRTERHLLKLVRHRNSETVVRRLIGTAQSEIGLERFVCIYEPKNQQDGLQVVAGGIHHTLHVPRREHFEGLMSQLNGAEIAEIHAPAVGGSGDELSCELARGGLRHAVAFPLSPGRRGMIAWADHKPCADIARRLTYFNDAAAELVENAESFERVEQLSHTDPLTGLYNHRYLQNRLAEEINRARRYRRTLGLVMIDVDLLKSVNDQYGHQAGDAVLCQMGKLFGRSVRDNDIVARYGGDEFCVVMPEADETTCELFMTRIRTNLASLEFELPDEAPRVKCSISLGAAVFPHHGDSAEKIVFAADMALLRSKEQGRAAGRTSLSS